MAFLICIIWYSLSKNKQMVIPELIIFLAVVYKEWLAKDFMHWLYLSFWQNLSVARTQVKLQIKICTYLWTLKAEAAGLVRNGGNLFQWQMIRNGKGVWLEFS